MSKRITAGVLEEVDDGATIWLHSLKDFEFAWRGCTHDVPKETKTMYIGRSRTPVRAAPWFIDFCLHLARSLKEYPSVETVASANQWEFADPFMSKARQYCKRCFPKALLDMKVVEGIMTTAVGSKVESTQLRIR
ncbi:hypothetical protein PsYK624_158170 [Phanerochaete sordida]|uniref:Uncharacterized protein n=1 Tax=Phanerochaete sordida TaxID=48140 RepID=A0A9P3LLM9_9APHY|nr:hypothetical protein PsYK624_158170 [Phanerochaete sordida]